MQDSFCVPEVKDGKIASLHWGLFINNKANDLPTSSEAYKKWRSLCHRGQKSPQCFCSDALHPVNNSSNKSLTPEWGWLQCPALWVQSASVSKSETSLLSASFFLCLPLSVPSFIFCNSMRDTLKYWHFSRRTLPKHQKIESGGRTTRRKGISQEKVLIRISHLHLHMCISYPVFHLSINCNTAKGKAKWRWEIFSFYF